MENSSTVLSAWDGNRLIGLANALDDSVMTAYMHYVLVDPEYHGYGIGKELMHRMKQIYNDYITLVLISYTSETGFYENVDLRSVMKRLRCLLQKSSCRFF